MDVSFLTIGLGGSLGVLGGALALGIRHGIDWDHIAAITDITSTTSASGETGEEWLTGEPGVLLTDESDHEVTELLRRRPVAGGEAIAIEVPARGTTPGSGVGSLLASQRRAILLGSLYAIGHGTVVFVLGLLAILAAGFLPPWIDPIMERVVGVTLIFLATYLFYSLYRYLRGKGEFRIRSRWMLVFAGVRTGANWLRARLHGEKEHVHVHAADQYGPRTAYSVGLIHGIGAETGTQVLIIATAVGAGTKAMGVAALLAFVVGILISNSFVTVATAAGFISAQRRQMVYVVVGLLAAVFSLAVGLIFLFAAGGILPSLGTYFRWIGGPKS
jgi:high-affinity nickel-transport protein